MYMYMLHDIVHVAAYSVLIGHSIVGFPRFNVGPLPYATSCELCHEWLAFSLNWSPCRLTVYTVVFLHIVAQCCYISQIHGERVYVFCSITEGGTYCHLLYY